MSAQHVRKAAENAATLSDLHRAYDGRAIDTAVSRCDTYVAIHDAATRCRQLVTELEEANDALLTAERNHRS